MELYDQTAIENLAKERKVIFTQALRVIQTLLWTMEIWFYLQSKYFLRWQVSA